MPKNFLEIHRYFALTSYRNTIGQSNNAFFTLGFSLEGKTKSPCFDLFIHWLTKQITKTYTETTFQAHTKIALPRVSTSERSHLFITQSEQEKIPSVSELANRLTQLTNKAGFKHDWKCYLFKRYGGLLKLLRVINSQISTCRWGLRCWILKWQTTTWFNVAVTIFLKRHCNWISEKRTLGPFIRGKIRRVLHKTRTFRINGTFRLK